MPSKSVLGAASEDAEAGIAAGQAGRFGLVVGVDHVGRLHALRGAGADVVGDQSRSDRHRDRGPVRLVAVYENFDASREGIRAALQILVNPLRWRDAQARKANTDEGL